MSLKSELVSLLGEFTNFLEYVGANKFKISAFRNGANVIRRYEGDLEEDITSGAIANVKGIGKGLLAFINEYAERKYVQELDELSAEIPEGIKQMMELRGLGAKKVRLLFDSHEIDSIDKLEQACRNNTVAKTKGFGEKTQEKIVESIKVYRRSEGYSLLKKAMDATELYLPILRNIEGVIRAEITGELRRVKEVISCVQFLAEVKNVDSVIKMLMNKIEGAEIEENKVSFVHDNRIQVSVLLTESDFESLLLQTTGSEEFLSKLGGVEANLNSEEEYFSKFELPFIIPNKREVEFFEHKELLIANNEIKTEDIKGLLHFHTTYSDGMNTLSEMAMAAKEYGLSYAAVTDHSKSAMYANGLIEERVMQQKGEAKQLSDELGFRIFCGIESDILSDGSLDYVDEFLKEFDFIVASIHSGFNKPEEEMNARIIKAIENPFTDVLGHPTGRLLLSRDGYKMDQYKIIDACVANNVTIELNCSQQRLDLDWRMLYYAREKGCSIAINPDSHKASTISDIKLGVDIARKAGVTKEDVINTKTTEEFIDYLNRKVKRDL